MPDSEIHSRFNEARKDLIDLAYELRKKGYTAFAEDIESNARHLDRVHHDYTELILDPA